MKRALRRINLSLYLSIMTMAAPSAIAGAGALDLSFGSGGVVNTVFSPGSAVIATDMALQSDGKIVVVGTWWNVFQNPIRMVLARYNADGSLDASFGKTGRVSTAFAAPTFGAGIAIQADGRIVAVGTIDNGSDFDYVVVRYESNGVPDPSFGSAGSTIINMGASDRATDLALQPDGKSVVLGTSSTEDAERVGLARLIPNGTLDTSFDVDGKVLTSMPDGWAGALAMQQDNKLVVAAARSPAVGTPSDHAVFRYNTDGSPDITFDGDGLATTSVGSFGDGAAGVAVQSDGKIVVVGSTDDEEAVFSYSTLLRYNSTGTLDLTFDNDGIVLTDLPGLFEGFSSVCVQSDGRIVAAGVSSIGTPRAPALVRYDLRGTLDTSFGNGGIKVDEFGYDSFLSFVALDRRGRIVTAGWNHRSQFQEPNILLARYIDHKTLFDFDADGRSDISVFRPLDSTWYIDRSLQGFTSVRFGLSTDSPAPADFDGDGKTDIAIFRNGTWWSIRSSDNTVHAVQFGTAGDIPIPADYTGDGRDELAVYRNGQWWALDLSNGQSSLINFGLPSDKPVPADYDGDGRVDQAVYRNGEWHIEHSTLGYTVIMFGLSSDRPVVGDYDGDGRADLGVYRNGTWFLQQTTDGFRTFQWGLSSDVPAPADYDGDGKTDAAVFRNGSWYVLNSSGGVGIQQFGLSNDKPIPAAYLP